jgi:serine/threonine-protein kinase
MARARVGTDDPEAARAAAAAAERAVALGPGLPHAHVALATVAFQGGEEVGPVRSLKHALRLSPDHADAHGLLGRILSETPLLAESARHLRTALALDPDGTMNRVALARVSELLGDVDEADRLLADPGTQATALLGRILLWRRDPERARRLLATSPPLAPVARSFLEVASGAPPPYAMLSPGERLTPRVSAFFAQVEAELAAHAGEHARALAALARAAAGTFFDVAWMDRCPLLADLRADPTFLAVRVAVAARAARVSATYLEPAGA